MTQPDPFSDFPTFLQNVTTTLDRLTTQANSLPLKSDLAFHKTLDRSFGKDVDIAGKEVLGLTERLLDLVEGSGRVKSKGKGRMKVKEEEDLVEGYRRCVGEVVDGLLEDADTCIDELNGQKKKGTISVKAGLEAKAGQKLPGPFSARPDQLSTSMFAPSNLPKPQLLFPIPVDNTLGPYTHSLTSKPHSLVPLTHIPTLNPLHLPTDPLRRSQTLKSLSHPYYYETHHLPYPTSMFITSPPVHPGSMGDSEAIWVDTKEGLDEMVGVLVGEGVKEVAVDLEHHNVRSYAGFTCLLQVSTRVREEGGEGWKHWDWVVDALKLRGELREGKLGGVLVDPKVIKVFHGADSDIPWLQKDFDIHIVNLFDTYQATKVLNKPNHSLKGLLTEYCSYETDKRLATSDWRIRPLPPAMFEYARSDTHFLLYIYDNLRNALLEKSASRASTPLETESTSTATPTPRENPQRAMREVLENSAETALRVYEREVYDFEGGKGGSGWAMSGRKVLGKGGMDREESVVWKWIHAWRDKVARELDESPFYIMPTMVMKIIVTGYMKAESIRKISREKAPIVAERAEEVAEEVKKGREEWRVMKEIEQNKGVTHGDIGDMVEDLVEKATRGPVDALPLAESSAEPMVVDEVAVLVKSKPYDTTGLWEEISSSPAVVKPTPKSTGSSLFGKTLVPRVLPTTTQIPSAGTSSLFGKTIQKSTSKKASMGKSNFDAVLNGIIESIAPAKPAPPPVVIQPKKDTLPEVETVPFIPTASRSTLPAPPPPPAPARPKSPEKQRDTVVQVKKSKSKDKDKGKSKSKAPPLPTSEEAGIGSPAPAKKAKKSKKPKVEDEGEGEVVEFDYSKAPNLLDNPHSGVDAEQGRKKKKKGGKSGGTVVLDTSFGKVPKDRSQPKQGNRSGTF